jgi:hypothetical protein
MAQDIKGLLTQHAVKDLLSARPLVYLSHKATIGELLEVLSSNGILSAPVFTADAAGAVTASLATLLGFADVWAVLVAFIQTMPAAGGWLWRAGWGCSGSGSSCSACGAAGGRSCVRAR